MSGRDYSRTPSYTRWIRSVDRVRSTDGTYFIEIFSKSFYLKRGRSLSHTHIYPPPPPPPPTTSSTVVGEG